MNQNNETLKAKEPGVVRLAALCVLCIPTLREADPRIGRHRTRHVDRVAVDNRHLLATAEKRLARAAAADQEAAGLVTNADDRGERAVRDRLARECRRLRRVLQCVVKVDSDPDLGTGWHVAGHHRPRPGRSSPGGCTGGRAPGRR